MQAVGIPAVALHDSNSVDCPISFVKADQFYEVFKNQVGSVLSVTFMNAGMFLLQCYS